MSKPKTTNNAVDILRRRYIGDNEDRKESLKEERVNAEVAKKIYDLRKEAGISQKELAEKIETTQSVISRLEDADYEGHSLQMLSRIAKALNRHVSIQMKPDVDDAETLHFVFQRIMRDLRIEQGLSIDQLAKKIGVDRNEIFQMECDSNYHPSPLILFSLSKFYKIPQRKLAMLAGVITNCPSELREEASRFAANSESFEKLSREEKKALDSFVKILKDDKEDRGKI